MRFLSEPIHQYLIRPLFRKYLGYKIGKIRKSYKESISTVTSEFLRENMFFILKKTDLCYLQRKHLYLTADLKGYNKKANDFRTVVQLTDGRTLNASSKHAQDFLMWRTELSFTGLKNNLAYLNFIEIAYYESLRIDTNALNRVYRWKRKRKKFETKAITQPLNSMRFYSLVVSVLDETKGHASIADLYEHFVEKTDIRFRHPFLGRRRGARIKLVNADDKEFLIEKLERIQHPNEVVILSPVTLARFVFHYESALIGYMGVFAEIGDIERDLLSLRSEYKNEYFLAQKLRTAFSVRDYRYTRDDAAALPKDTMPHLFKELIQYYVMNYSILTTEVLREREARHASKTRKQAAHQTLKAEPSP